MHYKTAYRVLIIEDECVCGPFWYLPTKCEFGQWFHAQDELFGCSSMQDVQAYFQDQYNACYEDYEGVPINEYIDKHLMWTNAYVIKGYVSGRYKRKSLMHKSDCPLASHEICFRSFKPIKKVCRLMDLINKEAAYGN